MPVMRLETAALLAELDSLAFPDRTRLLAMRARGLAGSRELGVLLDDLYGGDQFQRQIAVFLAAVAGERETIAGALDDPDWDVRRPAISAWLRSGALSSRQVAAFVTAAPWHDRRHVYRGLRRLRAAAVADGLVDVVVERFGDDEAARLLPACSAPVVARLLPELGHAVANWPLLGRRYPDVVLDVAEAELAELSVPDQARWWGRFGEGVLAAGAARPLRVLDLLERYAPPGYLPGPLRDYTALATADHARLLALMTAPSRAAWAGRARLPGTLLRRLSRLDAAELAPLARRLTHPENALVTLLRAVPPSRRGELYSAAYQGTERSQALPSDGMFDVLPRGLRWAEARRVLDLDQVRAEAVKTRLYTSFLPWEEAKTPLTEATRSPQADDRAAGYELLAKCAGRAGRAESVTEVIEYFRRLRNEQDPVRARALTALAGIGPRLLEPESASALEQIAADALAVRDASDQSRKALTALAVAVLREHYDSPLLADWSLRTLREIFGDRMPPLGRVDTRLRRGQEREFFAAVRDWLESGMQRGSCEPLFSVTRALGRRAWLLPELQDLLRRSTDAGNVSRVMRTGITLWLADPHTRAQRAEHVLTADPSAVAIHESGIWAVLCQRRTDLLDRFLAGTPPRGKFLAQGVRWVPLYSPGTGRWLPRQQAAYAGLLAEVAADAGAKVHERTAAIAAAAPLGDAGRDVVHRHLDGASTSLAEAALAALARTPTPREALPILLSHGGDDRARVAVYAAGQAARYIPPGELTAVFTAESVTSGKVTTRKEALRLAAALSVPDAGAVLCSAWRQPGQHRDVRAAVVSAARQRPHDPESWTILREAAGGGPADARAVIPTSGPLDIAPRYRHQYGELIALACRHPDQDTAKEAWRTAETWAGWLPGIGALITGQITDLDDQVLWGLAVRPLLALVTSGQPGAVLGDIVARLADLDRDMSGIDDPGRDRPARRRLDSIVKSADMQALTERRLRPALAEAGRILASKADCTRQAATLLVSAVDPGPGHGQRLAVELTEVCDLFDGAPATAAQVAQVLAWHVTNGRGDMDTLYTATAALASDPRLSAGLLATSLAAQGGRFGWPAPWRAQVRSLRTHPLPDVRAAALEIDMSPR